MTFNDKLLIAGAFAFTGGMVCLIVSMLLAKSIEECVEDFCSDEVTGAISSVTMFALIIGGPSGVAWFDGATDPFAYMVAGCCSFGALAFIALGLLHEWATAPAASRDRSDSASQRAYEDYYYGRTSDYPEYRYDDYRYAGQPVYDGGY